MNQGLFKQKQNMFGKRYVGENKIIYFYVLHNKMYTVSCYGANVNIDWPELVKFGFRVIFNRVFLLNTMRFVWST